MAWRVEQEPDYIHYHDIYFESYIAVLDQCLWQSEAPTEGDQQAELRLCKSTQGHLALSGGMAWASALSEMREFI